MKNGLKLYNTQTDKLEALDLSKEIGIYVCGITPYDITHIGHAFTYLSFDLLFRYLKFLGAKVKYVQNVTDIDDDILLRAKSTNKSWKRLADAETKEFLKDMDDLNWLRPDLYVKATKHIPEMIKIIQELVKKSFAYEKNGSVYFEVKKDPQFAQRFHKFSYPAALEIANERGNFPNDYNKKDPLDFVLWQAAKSGEPTWKSPWGNGRPGWHIECSAMSTKYLGQPVTIHGGGADLRFPHHEAEISQTESSSGEKFVKKWMHTAMVYCDYKKMSKSLGNMIFVRDLLKRYHPDAIRLYILSHHYRNGWNHEEKDLKKSAELASELKVNIRNTAPPSEKAVMEIGKRFFKGLNNDLDSPNAVTELTLLSNRNREEKEVAKLLATEIIGLTLN